MLGFLTIKFGLKEGVDTIDIISPESISNTTIDPALCFANVWWDSCWICWLIEIFISWPFLLCIFEISLINLPEELSSKLVSAEQLGIAWIETRTQKELDLFRDLVKITHNIIDDTFIYILSIW